MTGRTQLELKPFKVARHDSFAIELRGAGSATYDLCTDAWSNLFEDAEDLDPTKHF